MRSFTLPSLTIVCGKSRLDKTAANLIKREIVVLGGKPPEIRYWPPERGAFIVLGVPAKRPWLRSLLGSDAQKVPDNHEGYFLKTRSSDNAIAIIAGKTSRGTLNGAQTLCQLLSRDENRLSLREAQIRDWPSLRWRGVHLFLGNTALPFHKKLISNVLVRYKINRLVLQCEQAKWKSLGNVPPEWAMTKDDLRQELRYARMHGIEPVPLVNSCGHMQWLMKGTSYASLAEDPKLPYNISPTDPRAHRLLGSLYREVLDTFGSREFHIGGDEIIFGGGYPLRSATKHKRLCDLYVAHIRNLRAIARRHGAKTMFWGDMLFSKLDTESKPANAPNLEEAAFIRSKLAGITTAVDWHYALGDEEERLDILEGSGFSDVIGATWSNVDTIQVFSKALAQRGHRGLLQTTWVGYNSQEKNVKSAGHNFWNFILAAEMAWNGGSVAVKDLGYRADEVFAQTFAMPLAS